jgi:hypothetical protein
VQNDQDVQKGALDKQLDSIGWGLFLLMIGCLLLVPDEWGVPDGTWLLGTGLIILALVVVRLLNGIKISGFWVFLGVLALASGLGDVFGLDVPVFPILLILIGAGIILRPLIEKARS